MRDEVDVGTLTRELVTVVEETIQPAHISVAKNHPQKRRAGCMKDPVYDAPKCPPGDSGAPMSRRVGSTSL